MRRARLAVAVMGVVAAASFAVIPAASASPAHRARASVPIPLVTCAANQYYWINDYNIGFMSNPSGINSPETFVPDEYPWNPTNWCQEAQIGTWFELVQYGTSRGLSFDGSNNTLANNNEGGYLWQYWKFISLDGEWMLQSDYNNRCATTFSDNFNFGASLEPCGSDTPNQNFSRYYDG